MSKVCTKCGDEKPFSLFYKDAQKKDGISSSCKKCNQLATKSYYQKTSSPSRRNAKHGLSEKEYAVLWRTKNPEKIKQHRSNWESKNAHKIREKNMRRYISQTQQTPTWLSPAQKLEIEGMYLFCQIFKGFQVDHKIPIRGESVSGLHVPWNLQVLTDKQNRAKSNRLIDMENL
jgi:5-methylcytosine-specific restriction endonuclease McrA